MPATRPRISVNPQRIEPLACPQCESGFLVTMLCKRRCEVCGYVESCEDSFVPNQMNPASEISPRRPC